MRTENVTRRSDLVDNRDPSVNKDDNMDPLATFGDAVMDLIMIHVHSGSPATPGNLAPKVPYARITTIVPASASTSQITGAKERPGT